MEKNNFKLLEDSNGIINMHFTLQTENDINDFDNSYQFDLFFDCFKLTLRQSDYTFLMSCLDLNILYTDNQNDDYDYEKFYLNSSFKKNERSDLEMKELMEKYLSSVIFIQEISVNLCLKNDEIFSTLNIQDNLIIFCQKLDTSKITDCAFGNIEVYDLKKENGIFLKDLIVSDYSQKKEEYSYESEESGLSVDFFDIKHEKELLKNKKRLSFLRTVSKEIPNQNITLSSFSEL